MPRTLKRVLAILAVLVLLLIALAAVLFMVVDPNDYKDRITALVAESTGRTLVIEGDMKLSLFPGMGLVAERITLSGPTGMESPPLARASRFRVAVNLLPLVRGHLDISRLTLSKLDLHLVRFEDGRSNWAFPPSEAPPARPDEEPSSALSLPPGFSLAGVDIRDASVTWDDRSAGVFIRLRDLRLSSESLVPGQPSHLDLSCTAESRKPAVNIAIEASSRITLAPDGSHCIFEETSLKAHAKGDGIPGGEVALNLSTLLELDLSRGRAKADDLLLKVDETLIKGKIDLRDLTLPAVSFDLHLTELDLDRYMPSGKDPEKPAEKPPSGDTPIAFQGIPPVFQTMEIEGRFSADRIRVSGLSFEEVRLEFRAENGILTLDPLKARFYEGTLQGRAGLDASGPTPVPTLTLQAEEVQVGPVVRALTGKEEMTGTALLHMDVRSSGFTPDDWMADVSGPARFEVEDGTMDFFSVPQDTRAVTHEQAEPSSGNQPIPFEFLRGSIKARQGLLSNRDLLFESPVLRAAGKGTADLRRQQVDYTIKAILPLLPDISVHIVGPLKEPEIRVETLKILTDSVESLGKQAKDLPGSVGRGAKGLGEGVLKLPGSIGDTLKGLFD